MPTIMGVSNEVYTVLMPNSLPKSIKARIRRITLIIREIVETERGMTLLRTMARPVMPPTAVWLGIRKKNTAVAVHIVAKVIIA